MPEEPEIETNDLKETLDELQEERREREVEARKSSWVRYVSLSTAILAVLAAVGALQAGALVNDAMLMQLKASDTWNEYQADKQKDHLYTVRAEALLDSGARLTSSGKREGQSVAGASPDAPAEGQNRRVGEAGARSAHGASAGPSSAAGPAQRRWMAMPPSERLAQYVNQAEKESTKEQRLQEAARKLEEESRRNMERHELYARCVALIQVAIALSAVAALTRIRSVWLLSLVVGGAGVLMFLLGSVAR